MTGPLLGLLLPLHALAAPDAAREVAEGALTAPYAAALAQTAPAVEGPWWTRFNDPGLDSVIQDALRRSLTLRASDYALAQAAGQRTAARAPLLPRISFDASASGSPTENLGFQFGGFGGPSTVDVLAGMQTLQDVTGDGVPDIATDPLYVTVEVPQEEKSDLTWNGSTLFNAAWSVALWGPDLQNAQASRHLLRAAEGDRDAAAMAVATDVAQAWYDLVVANARQKLVNEQLANSRSLMELVELRYRGGEATGLEVLQQRQQLAQTEALVPAADQGVRRGALRLALALDRSPSAFSQIFRPGDALPALGAPPPLGDPMALLQRRPDLRAAIARADATLHSRRAAERALLPTLNLSANAGWQYFSQGELKSTDNWGIGASASVPIFNGGRTLGNMQAQRAAEGAAQARLRQAVQLAVQEVEDAALAVQQTEAERAAVQRQRDAARLAYEDARDRYTRGLVNLTTVLQTLTAWQAAELTLLSASRAAVGAHITLHDALGGDWPAPLRDGVAP